MAKGKSRLEEKFAEMWTNLYPAIPFQTECKLIEGRRFKHDFVFEEAKIAIEIQGAIFVKGGHNSPKGIVRDYTKSLLALKAGYSTIFLSSNMLTEEHLADIHAIIQERLGLTAAF